MTLEEAWKALRSLTREIAEKADLAELAEWLEVESEETLSCFRLPSTSGSGPAPPPGAGEPGDQAPEPGRADLPGPGELPSLGRHPTEGASRGLDHGTTLHRYKPAVGRRGRCGVLSGTPDALERAVGEREDDAGALRVRDHGSTHSNSWVWSALPEPVGRATLGYGQAGRVITTLPSS